MSTMRTHPWLTGGFLTAIALAVAAIVWWLAPGRGNAGWFSLSAGIISPPPNR